MTIKYSKKLTKYAKDLKKNLTLPEVLFWSRVKNKQLGFRFYRQKPIGNYIVDFYCARFKLIIEIDGRDHDFKEEYDEKRERYLESLGMKIIRFSNYQIYKQLDACIEYIEGFLMGNPECNDKRPI